MDYAQYVSRRPPSPPLLTAKLRTFSISPSASSIIPPPPTSSTDSPKLSSFQPSMHPQHANRFSNKHFSTTPTASTDSIASPHIATSANTSIPPTGPHRRTVRDEYAALSAFVKSTSDVDVQKDRQEIVRIRLEHMISVADFHSARVLTLALYKCNAKLDALASATRPADDARTRMRVIESKHFHGTRASIVPVQLRKLHIKRGALATLVDHITCTLHDQVRIQFLLTQLASNLSVLRSLLISVGRDRSSQPLDRFDRIEHDLASPCSTSNISKIPFRLMSHSNGQPPQRVESIDGRQSPNTRASFSADVSRHSTFASRMSYSYASRRLSQDAFLPTHRQTSPSSMVYSPLISPPHYTPGRPHTQGHHPNRRHKDGAKVTEMTGIRALSCESNRQYVTECDESSWWNDTPPPSATGVSTEPPSSTNRDGKPGRLSFVGHEHTRIRGQGRGKGHVQKMSSVYSRGMDVFPWRRRSARLVEDTDTGEEDQAVSLLSQSTVSDCHSSRTKSGSRKSHVFSSEEDVLVDIDSLCTEACSILSTSHGQEGNRVKRRCSISSGLWGSSAYEELTAKPAGWLGLGRFRAYGQIKKLWSEINDLFAIVVTHGPHLVEEKVIPASCLENSLLGPWNAGKQGSSLRTHFQTGVAIDANRRVNCIVNWQRKLVVSIRRDLYEHRKTLRRLDGILSRAYIASLENIKG